MIIEQTIDIPDNHRVFFDVPSQIPAGKAKIVVTILDYGLSEPEAFSTEEEAMEFAARLSKKVMRESW